MKLKSILLILIIANSLYSKAQVATETKVSLDYVLATKLDDNNDFDEFDLFLFLVAYDKVGHFESFNYLSYQNDSISQNDTIYFSENHLLKVDVPEFGFAKLYVIAIERDGPNIELKNNNYQYLKEKKSCRNKKLNCELRSDSLYEQLFSMNYLVELENVMHKKIYGKKQDFKTSAFNTHRVVGSDDDVIFRFSIVLKNPLNTELLHKPGKWDDNGLYYLKYRLHVN